MMSRKQIVPPSPARALVMSAALLGGAALTMSLSGCKKPPPPPPTGACCDAETGACTETQQASCGGTWTEGATCSPNPCPPPPPKDVKLVDLANDLMVGEKGDKKVDPRVQFADDVVVTEKTVDMGKAVIRFADAIARGDAKVARALMTHPAQTVLSSLESTGEWEQATGKIEAVRVVFLREGVDLTAAAVGTDTAGGFLEAMQNLQAELTIAARDAIKGLTPDQVKAFNDAIAEVQRDAMSRADELMNDPAALEAIQSQFRDAATGAGLSEEQVTKLNDTLQGFTTKLTEKLNSGSSGATGSHIGLLLAVQEAGGAYLLGWSVQRAGDRYVFGNAPSTPDVRARASAWDGIGPEGFQAMKLAAAPVPATTDPTDGPDSAPSDGSGSDGGGGGGGDPSAPSAPSSPEGTPPAAPRPPAGAPGTPGGTRPRGG